MGIKTKAALLKGPYDIDLIDRELICQEDEVIVRNHIIGICGSDKSFYRGQMPPKTAEFRQEPKFPFLLRSRKRRLRCRSWGQSQRLQVGDKVICFGLEQQYAEYFVAKDFQLQPAPEGMDMDLASLGEHHFLRHVFRDEFRSAAR